ncbi:MAG: lipopolysaccharide biosynthesis protein [Paludibacteraceae bacterium]|nr:lipopolysaccharide biosynthesis protein [Lachnospiraceae bacterium]MBR5822706.1 lipopolysaccharide biosynthesis protein [Paludibacteraceae bacterium]
MERISAQLVQLVVSIVLARILSPSDYGAVAMVTIFVMLANVLIEGGFSSALIQKKDADDIDFSTVFYFSIAFSLVLYAILYFSAPAISSFYGEEYKILTPVLRVLGIQVIIFAVNSVQQAYVQRQMMFKNFFWATLVGTIVSAVVGLFMAYSGFGIWSIVAQQLTAGIINTLTLYIVTRKLPIWAFSFSRLRSLFNYGVKLLGASLLVTGYQELRALIIGKLYTAQDLAFFDRGKQFPSLIVTNINSSIGAVLFPKMAKEQDSIEQIKRTTRMSIRFSSYIMSPIMFGLSAVSEPFIRIVLTEKWVGCVPLMQWFCLVFLFMPIHTANMQALKAIGRSDTFLKLELIKKTIELLSLFAVVWISVDAIVINMAILTTLFTAVNAFPNRKLLNYNYKEQIRDIFPSIIMSLVMLLLILIFNRLVVLTDLMTIFVDFFLGSALYIGMSIVTKNKEYMYITNTLFKRYGK